MCLPLKLLWAGPLALHRDHAGPHCLATHRRLRDPGATMGRRAILSLGQGPKLMADDRSHVNIGVIGGAGHMGQWLRSFWLARGTDVAWSDRDTLRTNADVVQAADLTFVAVPLRLTPSVIRDLAPIVSEGQCLVSIGSLMQPSAAELASVRGDAVCVHPIFGPTARQYAGLPIAVAGVRGNRWQPWLVESLRAAGMSVSETSPWQHDASMAVTQAMLHGMFVALCGAMSSAGLPPEAALEWASPTMQVQLGLVARILSQDAELYADLVVGNPWAPDRLESLAANLARLAGFARSGDVRAFAEAFRDARATFGESLEHLSLQAEAALDQLT